MQGTARVVVKTKDRLNCLHGKLIADKRLEDLERSIEDKECRE